MRSLIDNLCEQNKNYIAPFLWLHGENVEDVVSEIDKINNTGIREICLESRTYEDFCGDSWWADLSVIFEECAKRDMRIWILDDKHFPSGYANGCFEEKYSHLKKWDVIEKHIDVMGPVKDGAAMCETWRWLPESDEILAILACRRNADGKLSDDIIDITQNIRDGLVYFTLPEGCFRIVFIIKSRFYMGKRYEIFSDKLNPEATDVYLKEVYEPHYLHFSKFFGNTFRGFFSDEPGFESNRNNGLSTDIGCKWQGYPWHECVYKRLSLKYGNDVYKKLVYLWFDDTDNKCMGVRYDYMNIITDEYMNNFTIKIGQWCRKHNIEYIGHVIEDENVHAKTGSGAGHYFRALKGQDMSGVDVVLHQLIPGMKDYSNACSTSYRETSNNFYNYVLAKLASSDSHQDKLKNGKAMCELFGAYGWAEGTKIMKWLADFMIVRGINFFVPHAFSPKEDDPDCPPTFYNRGKNPLYPYMDMIMKYMNRCANLISDTNRIVHCAIVYDAEAIWSGENYVKNEDVARELFDNQIDYDFISEDSLSVAEIIDQHVKIGLASYSFIIVPYRKFITQSLEKSIQKMQENNITVIFVSDIPKHDIYQNSVSLQGEICDINCLHERLESICEYEKTNEPFLRSAHFKGTDNDIFMFSNEAAHKIISKKIKIKGFNDEEYLIYDALSNKIYRGKGDVKLNLYPYNSIIVIYGSTKETEEYVSNKKKRISEEKLNTTYHISVCRDIIGDSYEEYMKTPKLENITGIDGIHDFAGKIKYSFQLSVDKFGMYELDLGDVGECAEVFINKKSCGRCIVPPYQFDLGTLSDGKNYDITVIVATHSGYKYKDTFSRYLLFEPMGMLGEVKICEYKDD